MFDTVLDQCVLALGALILGGGLLFLFYPAIVDRSINSDTSSSSSSSNSRHGNDYVAVPIAMGTNNNKDTPILTLVIPAYEEEVRLPRMLQEAYTYLSESNCCALNDLASLTKTTTRQQQQSSSSNKNNSSKKQSSVVVEWIVVNDGSKDKTSQVYRDFVGTIEAVVPAAAAATKAASISNTTMIMMEIQHQWKLVSFAQNRGKGAAVQAGMLAATGDFCLMVDADGATDFEAGLEALTGRLVQSLLLLQRRDDDDDDAAKKENQRFGTSATAAATEISNHHRYPILLGSRAHLHNTTNAAAAADSTTTRQKRSFLRSFLMQAFHICVVVFVGAANICDTQCGFKLFHRATAATPLFRMLHLKRWAFDTELLYLATHLQYDLQEVVVPWHDVQGSKLHTSALNLALVSVSMLRDMVCVRLCYTLGLWKIRRKEQ